jgi:Tol biopolymer transport system component
MAMGVERPRDRTKSLRQLTDAPGTEAGATFSPDGSRIAYDQFPDEVGIHVMNADGSNERLVLPTDGDCQLISSADADTIYLTHDGAEIARLDVTSGKLAPFLSGDTYADIALSPDRSEIAYRDARTIVISQIDGTLPHPLTAAHPHSLVSWSPDGAWLVVSQSDGWLYLMRADGSSVVKWTEGSYPAWRP